MEHADIIWDLLLFYSEPQFSQANQLCRLEVGYSETENHEKKIKNFQKLGKKFHRSSQARNQLNSQFLSVELIQPGLHGGKWGHSSESALDCPFFCN